METLFVTGGTGYFGAEILRILQKEDADRTVQALARSDRSAARLEAAGAEVVRGDLEVSGEWQDVVAGADAVLHCAQPQAWGQKVTTAVAEGWEQTRLRQEKHLLQAASPGTRFVYVSGSSWFGHTGLQAKDETMEPNHVGWGPYQTAPQDQAWELGAELDLVMAHPANVYGPGSWYEEMMLEPLVKGARIYKLMGVDTWMSPMHVEDCARALLHLARVDAASLDEHGRQVLVCDDTPMSTEAFVEKTAAQLGATARYLPLPGFLVRLLAGEVVRSYLASQCVYDNARLKALGFSCRFPSAEEGIPDVIARWKADRD